MAPNRKTKDATHSSSPSFNKETRLLIGFFQQAIQVGDDEPDPAKYLKKFQSDIKTTGRLFKYLGLAKAEKQSPLGWKPTAHLLDLIAKSKGRRLKPTKKSASLRRQPCSRPDARDRAWK